MIKAKLKVTTDWVDPEGKLNNKEIEKKIEKFIEDNGILEYIKKEIEYKIRYIGF
jgi:hypothetical protein